MAETVKLLGTRSSWLRICLASVAPCNGLQEQSKRASICRQPRLVELPRRQRATLWCHVWPPESLEYSAEEHEALDRQRTLRVLSRDGEVACALPDEPKGALFTLTEVPIGASKSVSCQPAERTYLFSGRGKDEPMHGQVSNPEAGSGKTICSPVGSDAMGREGRVESVRCERWTAAEKQSSGRIEKPATVRHTTHAQIAWE